MIPMRIITLSNNPKNPKISISVIINTFEDF